jgi:Holliday junction resolvase RusA-like endonuclease
MTVEFTVQGVPVPQGSKTPWGSEDNPHTKPWRETVARAAAEHMDGGPFLGPVHVGAVFSFPRPKSHYRTGKYADWLKEAAPHYHTSTPDLDKLQRAIGDALTGPIVRNDSQIASWDVSKVYGLTPSAFIRVVTL